MKTLLTLFALFVVVLGGGAWWLVGASRKNAEGDEYTFVTAEYGRAAETISATGTVQAREVIPVGTELSGKVVEICATFNQVVEEGDVLLRLDDRAARQRLKQADVAVEVARVVLKQAEAERDTAEKAVRLTAWQARPDFAQWRTVWTLGADGKPQPLFVRVGGKDATGGDGIQDSQFSEVLEWEPDLSPRPDAKDKATYPRLIIGMPAAKKGGLFNPPKIKL